jgi:ferritin
MSIPIDGLDIDLKTMPIIHFATVTVDIENETSDLYNELLELGEESGNGFVKKFAYKFLKEQIEETDKASTIFDKVKNIGDNRALLQLFDNTFER